MGKSNSWQSERLVASEVRHRNSEIHSRVNKFAQNLHVSNLAVKAEKKSLDPRSKHARRLAFRRPAGKVLYYSTSFYFAVIYSWSKVVAAELALTNAITLTSTNAIAINPPIGWLVTSPKSDSTPAIHHKLSFLVRFTLDSLRSGAVMHQPGSSEHCSCR